MARSNNPPLALLYLLCDQSDGPSTPQHWRCFWISSTISVRDWMTLYSLLIVYLKFDLTNASSLSLFWYAQTPAAISAVRTISMQQKNCEELEMRSRSKTQIYQKTHRHQHALRLLESTAASAESQKHHQDAEAEQNVQRILIVLLLLSKRDHECGINQHPNSQRDNRNSGDLQEEKDIDYNRFELGSETRFLNMHRHVFNFFRQLLVGCERRKSMEGEFEETLMEWRQHEERRSFWCDINAQVGS